MRILSGIQPSGNLHIGNYLAMIRQMVGYQERAELFCFIANMHSLTSVFSSQALRDYTQSAVLDLLALGIDPDTSYFWVQSDVPEVTELTWYLNNVTPVALLERCTSYKDKVEKQIPANNGLLSYPVLQAADILLYDTNMVPVGKDQKQHLEITRDIAIKFNNIYGRVFVVPEPEIKEDVAVVPGIDGQKMSKSYGNTIDIFAPEKQLKKSIMGIVTDSTPVEAPKDPDKSIVYAIYRLFASPAQASDMADKFRRGGYGYGDAKKELFALLMDFFSEQRKKRESLQKDPSYVAQVRQKGAHKVRLIAQKTLQRVRESVGV